MRGRRREGEYVRQHTLFFSRLSSRKPPPHCNTPLPDTWSLSLYFLPSGPRTPSRSAWRDAPRNALACALPTRSRTAAPSPAHASSLSALSPLPRSCSPTDVHARPSACENSPPLPHCRLRRLDIPDRIAQARTSQAIQRGTQYT